MTKSFVIRSVNQASSVVVVTPRVPRQRVEAWIVLAKLLHFRTARDRLNRPRSSHVGQLPVIGHAEYQAPDVAEILA